MPLISEGVGEFCVLDTRSQLPTSCSLKVILFFLLYVFPSVYSSFVLLSSRKRKESEPRTKCLLNNADITPHHPTDPVEMRRINFQTAGTGNPYFGTD